MKPNTITNNEDLSSSDIYKYIETSSSIYNTKSNDEIISVYNDECYQVLERLEEFVAYVITSNDEYPNPDDEAPLNGKCMKNTTKSKICIFFNRINSFITTIYKHDAYYIYSENIRLFQEACNSLKLHPQCFTNPLDYNTSTKKYAYEIFNDLIKLIRCKSKTVEFSKRVTDRANYANRMFKKLKDYVDALFAKHSRLIVIRLDLSYHVSNDIQPKQLVTLQQAKNDLAHLLKNTRHNALFEHVVGYIWKLEYGQSRGYHYHVILFFLGSKVQKDVYIAMQIGKYWSEVITNKRGHYYNCNNDKAKHDSFGNLGIGRINADDANLRFNLLNKVVKYFTKKEQYLQLKLSRKDRVFGKGRIPDAPSGRGKPRNKYISEYISI